MNALKVATDAINELGIVVLPWPSQSPDLNPIEHIWADVKRRVALRQPFPTLDAVWEAFQDEWEKTDPALCARVIGSMPQHLQDVIAAKGGHTRW